MEVVDLLYPVKIVSRTVQKKRARRFSTCIIGLAFGIGCAATLFPIMTSIIMSAPVPVQVAANTAPAAAPAVAPVIAHTQPQAAMAAPAAEAPAPVAAPAPVVPVYPLQLSLKVESGDTLINLLTDAGVPHEEANAAVEAVHTVYDPRHLDVGQNIAVRLDNGPTAGQSPVIASLTIPVSPISSVALTRRPNAGKDGIFAVKKTAAEVETALAHAGGPIKSSIYETAADDGIPASLISEIINAYSYDVDFQRDIQPGDMLDVMYERRQTKNGMKVGYGNVLYAELNLGDRILKIYRYTDKNGNADYYDEKGESVRKALLRTPVNGAHITSRFGMRFHPILGYSRMHRGIDFGAPIGTPIYAAGDGTVEFEGRKSGYGNFLVIRHNRTYSTAYAHISRFAKHIAPGMRVKQGQIVAYVGMTGMATGPHLHYEVRVNGTQVNPASVHFKTGTILTGRELTAFRAAKHKIESQMAALTHSNDKVAMAAAQASGASD